MTFVLKIVMLNVEGFTFHLTDMALNDKVMKLLNKVMNKNVKIPTQKVTIMRC